MKPFISIFTAVATAAVFLVPALALAAGPAPLNLGSSGDFVILTKTGITDTGTHASAITGDIGSSPITSAAMNDVFCSELTGIIHGVDAAYVGSGSQTCFAGNPPLSNKTLVDNAVLDMEVAYANASGRTNPTATELGAGNIGGMTLAPGLYKWSTDVSIPTSITLSGSANDVWIFQIAGNLDVASAGSVPAGVKVVLAGGAKASNVFWQVGGVTGATLGTYSTFNGTLLTAKQITIQTGAVLNGRALAQTQVTLDANSVSIPEPLDTSIVTIQKYIDGHPATASSGQNLDFPMTATWNAANIGSGTGGYSLSPNGYYDDPTPYQAETVPIDSGGSYSTSEITSGPAVSTACVGTTTPFSLVGYTTGDTLAEAAAGTPTTTAPSFTGLTTNKYVIVWNHDCSNSSGTIGGDVSGGSPHGTLSVTSIDPTDTSATADGTFENGWKYTFHITIPNNEPNVAMKFANWLNATPPGTIPVANNMRISSAQADNGGATVLITAANTYSSPALHITGDLDPTTPGDQIEILVEAAVPTTTPNGSYTTSYGVQTLP